MSQLLASRPKKNIWIEEKNDEKKYEKYDTSKE